MTCRDSTVVVFRCCERQRVGYQFREARDVANTLLIVQLN